MCGETVLLGPTGHLQHKDTVSRLYLPNIDIQKQTQRGGQNEETKKLVPRERTGEISRKELNKMEASKRPDTEFKTVVIRIRMLKELSEIFNSMRKDMEAVKKNQSEMKNK